MVKAAAASLAIWLPFLASACSAVGGPVLVEVLVPDPEGQGGVRLDDAELSSVIDLHKGTGALFDIRGGMEINALDADGIGSDFDDVVAQKRGTGGTDLMPRMSFDGTRYVALDFETLTYFTLFENFEEAFQFASAIYGDDSGASGDKGIVALFGSLQLAEGLPIPIVSSDNAAYVPLVDGWLALRTGIQDGVPFAMHRGVIAHEFGHRLFFHNAFIDNEGGFDVWRQRLDTELGAADVRAQTLLSGVDEGLADLFAIAALGDKDAVNRAFAEAGGLFEGEADRRDLEGEFATVATYDNLAQLAVDTTFLEACSLTAENFAGSFNFYCLGTVVAAALWDGSGRDLGVLRTEVGPAVVRALPRVGEVLVQGTLFDVDVLLEAIAATLGPGGRKDAVCAAFSARFASLVAGGRVPSCL